MKLLIVESPTKAKTIRKYLGDDFRVIASVGHVRDLPKSNKDAVDIEHGFTPKYVVPAQKAAVMEEIHKESSAAEEVLLATDPDREGEAIAWHIQEAADLHDAKRVVFHEITENAVKEAVKHPRKVDTNLRKAQEARRVLDRLVGYDLSGLIWKKVRYGLSAGRVQSPALRILMEKERTIRAFVPETYFIVTALAGGDKHAFLVSADEEINDANLADKILKDGPKATWEITDIKETKKSRKPSAPFTTSTMQQSASTRLGFSPSRAMRAAQKLYEAGSITYMRTDSVALSKDAMPKIAKVVEKEFGKEHLEVKEFKTKSKNAQEAHEAIRPTDISLKSAGKSADEKALYELIRTRTIASQMKSAETLSTKVIINTETDLPDFAANGSRIIYPGWLLADTSARKADNELPKLEVNKEINLKDFESEEKQTEPPKRYTEAGLIKELEKRGIGRPSTYASIMRTIIDRGYVEKQGRTLIPTDTGDVVSSFLENNFANYVSDNFTAEMEDELDEIAEGKRTYEKTLSDFYTPFKKEIEGKEDIPKLTNLGPAGKEHKCPKCDSDMHFKLGRGGIFMSCDKFPECDGARTKDGEEIKDDEPIGNHPETDEPIFVKTGRFGPYVEMGIKEGKKKPKRGSIPADKNPEEVTIDDAVKYLSLPRVLGENPDNGKEISASIGRFGPYVVCDGEFRSVKDDDIYTISLDRALEIIREPKKPRKGVEIVREIGPHPRTKKPIIIYKSKSGIHLKKGLKNVYIPEKTNLDKMTVEDAVELLKNS